MFVLEKGGTLAIFMFMAALKQMFMFYRTKLWAVFMYCYISLEVFMHYWNLEQTRKGHNPKLWQKVRGGLRPGSVHQT